MTTLFNPRRRAGLANIARLSALAAAAIIGLQPSASEAQAFPTKPIRFIVPYSPGGLPDTVARIVSTKLGEALGTSVYVENKPGAGGAVAAGALMTSPADGYTMMVTDGPMLSITPIISTTKLNYDADKDFVPVSLVGTAPLFLAVNPKVPANNLKELIALVKSKPGALNYGSSGVGSIHQLTAEAMKSALGLYITHIPFKGSANSVPAMIGGQVDMVFSSPPSLNGFVKNGQARLIAINSAKRSPLAPDVPALSEVIPGFDFAFNVAILARTGTPKEAIDRVSREVARIVKMHDVIDQFATAGVDPVGSTPQELSVALRKESTRVLDAAKRADLKAE